MKPLLFLIILFTFNSNAYSQSALQKEPILKIEMKLSAFGVESDDFPNMDVSIDLIKKIGKCKKWYFNPQFKDSSYELDSTDINKVIELLNSSDLSKLKTVYKVEMTDQPSSRTKIIFEKHVLIIDDYGLSGDHPLKQLYKIVYKL